MTRNRGLSTRGGGSNFWICKTCSKKFTKISDQLMECEYCENHYCSTCLGMTDTDYEHHVHSSGMVHLQRDGSLSGLLWGLQT